MSDEDRFFDAAIIAARGLALAEMVIERERKRSLTSEKGNRESWNAIVAEARALREKAGVK